MTIKDVQKVVDHWYGSSASDVRSAHLLLVGKQLLQSLFFCHLAIEKTLKAIIVKETKDHAPFVHNLVYLAGKTSLELTKDDLVFLELMSRYNIEGRYPSYQAKLRKDITRDFVVTHLRMSEEFIRWCQKHL